MYAKTIIEKLLNENLQFIFQKILSANGEIRFIGGAVRDLLSNENMDMENIDIDLASNFSPEQIIKIFSQTHVKLLPTGIDFGTITIVCAEEEYQVTTLRKDLSCNGRHAKIEFSNSWEEDAARRDFTINAISIDVEGEIYDYFNGVGDLEKSIVRFIGDPAQRIEEDYLRILRYYRFSGKFAKDNNNIADTQVRSICREKSFLLKKLSVERIYAELNKVCSLDNWQEIFTLLLEDGILQAITGIDFVNKEEVTKIKVPKNINVKSKQIKPDLQTIISFLLRDSVNEDSLKKIFYTRKDLDLCNALINFPFKDAIKNGEYDKFFYYTNKYFLQFLIFYGSLYNLDIELLYKKYADKVAPIFPVSGKDLINIGYKSGAEIGNSLKYLENLWIDSNFNINKNDLLQIARNANEKTT